MFAPTSQATDRGRKKLPRPSDTEEESEVPQLAEAQHGMEVDAAGVPQPGSTDGAEGHSIHLPVPVVTRERFLARKE